MLAFRNRKGFQTAKRRGPSAKTKVLSAKPKMVTEHCRQKGLCAKGWSATKE